MGFPESHVCVKHYTRQPPAGWPLVSLRCLSPEELEREITRLKRELDAVLKKAKKKYAQDYARFRPQGQIRTSPGIELDVEELEE